MIHLMFRCHKKQHNLQTICNYAAKVVILPLTSVVILTVYSWQFHDFSLELFVQACFICHKSFFCLCFSKSSPLYDSISDVHESSNFRELHVGESKHFHIFRSRHFPSLLSSYDFDSVHKINYL